MRVLIAMLCAVLTPGLASANELLKAYEQALINDTQLQAAASARDAAVAGRKQAFGALLPQVTGSGRISNQSDEVTIPGRAPVTTTSEPYNVGINITQALFNKSLWDQVQQAGGRRSAAEAAYRSAEQNLTLRVAEAYFNLLSAADSVRLADAEKNAIERQLELAKKRFEVGLDAITGVQEAQARYDLSVALMIEAEQAQASAREGLAEITGYSYSRIAFLREDIPLLGPNPDSVIDWVSAAMDGNLTLLSARIQAEIAKNDIDISQDEHLPTLTLNGQKNVGEQAGVTPAEYDGTSATLQLNVPIFAGGSTQAGVRVARSLYRQRLAELEGTRRQVERRTRDAYQGVIAGVARVRARKQAVLSNTTALEAADVGLEVGTRTAVDALNAQRELYSAERDYARARYDYLLNVLRLKNAAGQLTPNDLTEIDKLLVD